MKPGPNHILRLPVSGTLVKIATINSGNTFGARYWTDGRREAPMLPDAPWLRRQPVTRELFWTDECEKIAEEEPWGSAENEYEDVPFAAAPPARNYLRALASGLAATPGKERYLRTRLWWVSNDPVRRGKAAPPPTDELKENLRCLRDLLDMDVPDQRLMAAEICRESGEFTAAREMLEFRFPEGFGKAVDLIKKLNEAEDLTVREIA